MVPGLVLELKFFHRLEEIDRALALAVRAGGCTHCGGALHHGIDTQKIEGVVANVTTAAHTVADCFKYRNKIGLDVALEALREYTRSRRSIDDLTRAASSIRVANVIRPYLDAMVA